MPSCRLKQGIAVSSIASDRRVSFWENYSHYEWSAIEFQESPLCYPVQLFCFLTAGIALTAGSC